jgi:NAD+ synthase
MELNQELFTIDAPAVTARLCDFIQDRQAAIHRQGILVALSGGLDSSTVLLLCTRAAGAENITALMMPERQGNPAALRYGRLVARQFGIKTLTRDISPILRRLGTYDFILSVLPSHRLQEWASRKYLKSVRENPFLQIMRGETGAFSRRAYARYASKQRVRLVVTYLLAEERNLLVVGCAHKSEDLLGLYVKFGVDDNADVMPLKNLYRSQILKIAAHLGVPDEIMHRTPNPDIIPGVQDKYMDVLGLPSSTLDLLVYGIEHGLENGDIVSQLRLPVEKVRQIRDLVQQTGHMRQPSQTLSWE